MKSFNYLKFELSLDGVPDLDQKIKEIPKNMRHYQKTCKKNRTDNEMKFNKIVVRPTLLYCSDTWVTTKRDMTGLDVAEMRFRISVKGYIRRDKVRCEIIRKEAEIPGIQDVRSKYKQNWINHLERIDNSRLPKYALNYKPRGRRDRGRHRKRWQSVDVGTGQTI